MDKRVYLLTIVAFIVGMVELIIGGILDLVATDLNVSLGKAGLLITIFSLVFAVSAPILLVVTAKVERKKLSLLSLFIFFIGNIIAIFSPSFSVLMIARIISAASGSLLIVLCITIASSIVPQKHVGRAIGIVVMGISGSLVFGVPIGLMLGNSFGWRAPFILITGLTLLLIIGIYYFMEKIAPQPSIPLKQQLATLKNSKILFAHITMFLFLAGHMVLYAYFTPFLKTILGLDATWVSIVYLVFGVAAITGGGLGGTLADRFGAKPVILTVITVFAIAMFSIPVATFSLTIFLIIMIIWGMMNWAITPALQSYLIESAPETAAIQQSLNNSALHFGIAFGSLVGGVVIERTSVEYNATVGGLFIILALGAALFSMTRKTNSNINER
ncbi:MAG TPA: MFS transporter [Virgibacillus sp.]|nr:MFS transporter [Virgibacillus sp.]